MYLKDNVFFCTSITTKIRMQGWHKREDEEPSCIYETEKPYGCHTLLFRELLFAGKSGRQYTETHINKSFIRYIDSV